MILLAAGVQAVHVINTPLPVHITDAPDSVVVQTLWYAKATFWATVIGIGIATIAAAVALYDVIRNTNQVRDFYRRPDFKVSYWAPTGKTQRGQERDLTAISFTVLAQNVGERMTRDIKAEILVPLELLNENTPNGAIRVVNGIKYRIYENISSSQFFYPFALPKQVISGTFVVRNQSVQPFTALWRIYDEYGNYPRKRYGEITFPHA